MQSPIRKLQWVKTFKEASKIYNWETIAWVVLDNHYHIIVRSPDNARTLSKFISSIHKYTARLWNEDDGIKNRKVWWNYWDTCIRSEHDYYNRVKYVLWNPVKHELTETPENYPFSNYSEFSSQDFMGNYEVTDVPEY